MVRPAFDVCQGVCFVILDKECVWLEHKLVVVGTWITPVTKRNYVPIPTTLSRNFDVRSVFGSV